MCVGQDVLLVLLFFVIVKYGRYYCGACNIASCVLKWPFSMCGEIGDCGDDDASL